MLSVEQAQEEVSDGKWLVLRFDIALVEYVKRVDVKGLQKEMIEREFLARLDVLGRGAVCKVSAVDRLR